MWYIFRPNLKLRLQIAECMHCNCRFGQLNECKCTISCQCLVAEKIYWKMVLETTVFQFIVQPKKKSHKWDKTWKFMKLRMLESLHYLGLVVADGLSPLIVFTFFRQFRCFHPEFVAYASLTFNFFNGKYPFFFHRCLP